MPDDSPIPATPPQANPGPTPTGYQRTQGGSFKWVPPSAEELSKILPQYEVEALVGRGGMGAVYRGKQKALDRTVAIKILPPEVDAEDDSYTQRFKNEAKIMAKLEHPAIVPVHDFGETSTGLFYFVMGFIDGTDVHQMIQSQGRLPPEHALAITAHVCDALAYAHKNGVIHRDIKPSNVLINMDGQVKVADFGLAKVDDPSQSSGITKTGLAMGTPDYVAPETLTLGMTVDGRADLYAVGVMLYQMLTGNVPRGMFTMPSVMIKEIDPRFDQIVAKAMKYDREERYASASDIRRDLDAILTMPLVQAGGQSSAAIPKQSLPQKPVAKGPQKPMGKSANVPVKKDAAPAASANPKSEIQPPKSKTPLLIGIGAVAAIAVGAFVMMIGKKDAQPGGPLSPLSGTSVSSASDPAQMTERTTTPIKVREEPKPSAPAPISNPKSTISDSNAEKFPPGKWVKVFTKAEDLPEDLRKPNSGVKFEDGWIRRYGTARKAIPLPSFMTGNYGVRGHFVRGHLTETFAGFDMRCQSVLAHFYRVSLDSSGKLRATRQSGDNYSTIFISENLLPIAAGTEYRLQAAVVGQQLIGRYGESPAIVGIDGEFKGGRCFLNGGESFRDIEVINLDGIPEAEALKILGVDEKGNDLRGAALAGGSGSRETSDGRPSSTPPAPANGGTLTSSATSGTAPASAISNSKSPISNAAPAAFPPGQWVKVFTKFEDLPADLRKPDSGVKFEDGWLNLGSKQVWLRFPTSLSSNYGIRAHFRHRKNAFGAIVLRRQETSKPALYQLRYLDNRLSCQRRDDASYHDIQAIAVRKTAQSENESTLEFAVVGARLIGRLDSDAFATGIDATHAKGVAHIYGDEDLRDIEVINLDGIPEAEALRILGVDEKGNDLRALATKQEQQKAEQAKQADTMAAIPELKTLHEQFVKLQGERVTAPFEKDVAALNTSYLGGLDRKIAEQKKKGDLDGVLVLEAEKKLVASTGSRSSGDGDASEQRLRVPLEATATAMPIPAEDDDTTPATLKDLRKIYRDAFAKLEATRAANLKALTDPLSIRLKQLESTLTQKNRVPDAKVVREYREGLGQSGSLSPLSGTSSPQAPEPAQRTVRTTKKFPPGDDRKAAEWVLSVGGTVVIINGGTSTRITDVADLPRGRFEVTSVYLEFRNNPPKAPITDLAPLAGLRELKTLNLSSIPLGDEAFEIIPSLPSLNLFRAETMDLTDDVFTHFGTTNVSSFGIYGCGKVKGEKIGALSNNKILAGLNIQGCGLTTEGVREIARLPALKQLNVSHCQIGDEALPALAALTRLTQLTARVTAISAEALTSLRAWSSLSSLEVDIKPGDMADGCERLSKAFPKLEVFGFFGADDWRYTADDLRGLNAFPKLRSLIIWNKNLSDGAVAGLLDLDKLESLRFDGSTALTDAAMATLANHKTVKTLLLTGLQLTDASLTHLAKLRSLKKLEIKSCPNLTDAAIAAFKKARPDVTVTR